MHEIHEFLRSLTVVLIVAAITTVVFQRLRQPVVLGYIIAGLVVGPHVPVPIVVDPGTIQTLSELGVILLMFSLGLEFNLAKLARVGPAALVVGMLVVPRFIRYVTHLGRAETTLVASIGICFATAYLAQRFGYSVALGAFIAGSLVAESGKGDEIERLVQPVRDVFAAIFFVSVGMLMDPALVAQHGAAVGALTLLVVVGKVAGVSFGAFLAGFGPRTSLQAGM